MLPPLTFTVVGVALALLIWTTAYAVRDRLINDAVLAVAALLEVLLVVQAVIGIAQLDTVADQAERATFAAYLVSLPLVPIGTVFLAIKEKSRWAMGAVAIGAFAVVVMAIRLHQIWTASA